LVVGGIRTGMGDFQEKKLIKHRLLWGKLKMDKQNTIDYILQQEPSMQEQLDSIIDGDWELDEAL